MEGISYLWIVIVVLILGMMCLVPALMAKSRGRSSIGWFIFSIIFTPILGALIVAALGNTRKKEIEKERRLIRQLKEENERI